MNIGILIFDGAEELDFVGPWEAFTMSNVVFSLGSGEAPDRVFLVSETGGTVTCAKGMRVESDYSIVECPPLDVLLVPGGQGTRREISNRALLDFIEDQAARCTWVTSVCTGAFLLVAAGPAKGKQVTTHWYAMAEIRAIDGVGEVLEGVRYVQDGTIVTSAGVSAGIDMALWLIGQIHGEVHGALTQRAMEYDPAPPFKMMDTAAE